MTSHRQTVWENEETGAFYSHLQPDAGYKIKYRNQPRRKDTTITRLRLGQSMTNAGLYKIRLRDNADCAICRTPETPEHFLLTCPVQQQLQDHLRRDSASGSTNPTTSRSCSQQHPGQTLSTTGSCYLSDICKQTRSNLEDYATSIFTVKKRSLNTNFIRLDILIF